MPIASVIGSAPCVVSRARSDSPVDERHRVVRHAVHLPRREHGHDVRMLQPRRELDLALEPLGVDAGQQLRRQHLHDDVPPQRLLARHEHARHAAAAELALDRVRRAERVLQLVAKGHWAGEGDGDAQK